MEEESRKLTHNRSQSGFYKAPEKAIAKEGTVEKKAATKQTKSKR